MYYMMMFYMILVIILVFLMFLYFLINQLVIYLEFEVLLVLSMKFELLILLDWVSMLFLSVVLMISMMVIFYSIEYMVGDLNIKRFMFMIFMFVMSMMFMIMSPNLISILIGWDGLGLVSYCLVIYYQSKVSFNSGMVTVLMNRIGDILILLSISLLISLGSWNFMFWCNLDAMIYLFLILASFTKSSQLPFSSWLPMAMAAPTPVSSLVHSSTLVTAGVYLLIRLNYLMLSENLINYMLLISVMTMFLSGLGANFEFDLKKIIALSTLSQLGVMIFCLSMKFSEITFFHLLTHAMFKSMLFLCAGVIIHYMNLNQDIRYISMILYNMPLVSILFNCSTLSLCGVPFLSGFFSKDLILDMYMMSLYNKFIIFILFMSMGLTISYSLRLIYYTFIKSPQLLIYNVNNLSFNKMLVSMYMLFFMSIMKGLILSWILFSFKNLIFLTFKFKMLIYNFMIMGILLSKFGLKYYLKINYLIYLNNYLKFYMNLWFMPMLYSGWIFKVLKFSNDLIYYMELGWLEYILGGWIKFLLKKLFGYEILFNNFLFLLVVFMFMVLILMF